MHTEGSIENTSIAMMHVEYLCQGRRSILEYERGALVPAVPVDPLGTRPLFRNGKWKKGVSLNTANDVLARLPVGASIVNVEERAGSGRGQDEDSIKF